MMSKKSSVGMFLFYSAMTTLLTTLFMFAAPMPARCLHIHFGKRVYWAFCVLSSIGLFFLQPQWALMHFTVLLAVGLFTELEQQYVSTFYAAASAITVSGLSLLLMLMFWARMQGVWFVSFITSNLSSAFDKTAEIQNVNMPVSMTEAMAYLPALTIIVLMFVIFSAVVFVRPGRKEPVTLFALPSFMIWPLILSLAGAFLVDKTQYYFLNKMAGNVLFICCALYYFQGLSVMAFFFNKFKLSYWVKFLLFFVVGFQFFPILITFGVSDFWVNFRKQYLDYLLKDKKQEGV